MPSNCAFPTWLAESKRSMWEEFYQASTIAYQQFSRVRSWALPIVADPTDSFTFLWPSLGGANRSNNKPFGQKTSVQFVMLVIDQDPSTTAHIKIFASTLFLATRWHIEHSGLCLHASAVARIGRGGFLFLGDSGNGKTTVAKLSDSVGYVPLGDDLNFVIYDGKDNYQVMIAPSPSLSLVRHSALRTRLRGIFSLVKDTSDYLSPMSPMSTTRVLFDSVMQVPRAHKLDDRDLSLAFQTCCDVAHSIPGYELHFRKSPEFWKLIDERFPG